jgi:transcription antitermination factor NusG
VFSPITPTVEPRHLAFPGHNGVSPAASQASWYAAYVCVRHEKMVARQFASRDLECFLPMYRTVHRWKDRYKGLDLALFPGYVFVRIELKDRVRVLQVPSVVSLVGFDGRPVPIHDNEIETLRHGLDGQVRIEPHPYLKEGRRVRIKAGPFIGAEGILLRKKDCCRVVLSIDLLMRSVAVEVSEADVEVVG